MVKFKLPSKSAKMRWRLESENGGLIPIWERVFETDT
jgi:hypothetical protein